LLIPLVMSKGYSKPNITNTITLSPSAAPAPGRQVVDAAYQSFSIEFSYMADYGGNDTYRAHQFNSLFCSLLTGPLEIRTFSPNK
jgi:hypothetical protein